MSIFSLLLLLNINWPEETKYHHCYLFFHHYHSQNTGPHPLPHISVFWTVSQSHFYTRKIAQKVHSFILIFPLRGSSPPVSAICANLVIHQEFEDLMWCSWTRTYSCAFLCGHPLSSRLDVQLIKMRNKKVQQYQRLIFCFHHIFKNHENEVFIKGMQDQIMRSWKTEGTEAWEAQ